MHYIAGNHDIGYVQHSSNPTSPPHPCPFQTRRIPSLLRPRPRALSVLIRPAQPAHHPGQPYGPSHRRSEPRRRRPGAGCCRRIIWRMGFDASGPYHCIRARVRARWVTTSAVCAGAIMLSAPSSSADVDPAETAARILFTHVPLSRPEGASCGPLRERGTIHQGRGLGYQNLLTPQASQFLLQSIRPAIVFR